MVKVCPHLQKSKVFSRTDLRHINQARQWAKTITALEAYVIWAFAYPQWETGIILLRELPPHANGFDYTVALSLDTRNLTSHMFYYFFDAFERYSRSVSLQLRAPVDAVFHPDTGGIVKLR